MTLKEAVLKSLNEIDGVTNYSDVYNHIIEKKYYDFGTSKTPSSTVSAQLGAFIRNGDVRVKRIKVNGGIYSYYLTKNEANIAIDALEAEIASNNTTTKQSKSKLSYDERDLHKLLSTYLKNTAIYSKTIFHEQSNRNDSNQIWTHPDMIGIKFLPFRNKTSENFLKAVNRFDTFKITSYEIKKEIITDNDLKQAFFQAVSNSSWANYGYLVAFEFSSRLMDEIERLNQAFGIGIIKLNANPFETQILFQARYQDLDFKTLDKICNISPEFEKFIEHTEKLITAAERYQKSTERELSEFCDSFFSDESEIKEYCISKNIPWEEEKN